jgi:hypothetical protein
MCDYCIKILGKCVSPHYKNPDKCPLKTASYCCLCASYGHTSFNCKEDTTYRRPQFLEQLIPPSLLEQNRIVTNTPIISTNKKLISMVEPLKAVIDVIDHPKVIKSVLKNMNSMPKKTERGVNKYKKQLHKVAKERGEDVVYHSLDKFN